MFVKQKIPKAIREQVWLTYIGKRFENKCCVVWCSNVITPFTYEVGHNIPESKGGSTMIDNLRPICRSCNGSLGSSVLVKKIN
jgi:5-methylcytosine-specific restriction endonuclease McrA